MLLKSYLEYLCDRAVKECTQHSPLQMEGTLLCLEIQNDLGHYPPEAFKEQALRLREILDQLEREQVMENSRKQALHLVMKMPEFRAHLELLNEVEPPEFRAYLVSDICKGEMYG